MMKCVLVTSALLAVVLLAAVPATAATATSAGSSCSASGIFSSCHVTCDPGQRPICSTGFLGTSVSCECLNSDGSSSVSASVLSLGNAQQISYRGYSDLLGSFGTPEADNALVTAQAMEDAAEQDDYVTYELQATAHEDALNQLSPAELDAVEQYIFGPGITLP